jgi:hypothetical protein
MTDDQPTPDGHTVPGDELESPGDAQQVPVPHEHAMPGTSEQTPKAEGILTYPEKSDPDP